MPANLGSRGTRRKAVAGAGEDGAKAALRFDSSRGKTTPSRLAPPLCRPGGQKREIDLQRIAATKLPTPQPWTAGSGPSDRPPARRPGVDSRAEDKIANLEDGSVDELRPLERADFFQNVVFGVPGHEIAQQARPGRWAF